MEKIKVLMWADYCCSTGFSCVSSNIWQRLMKTGKYELDVVGINYSGDPYDTEKFPGNVYTAMSGLNLQPPYNEPYGRQKLLDILGSKEYDVIFLLQDTFVLQTIIPQIKELQAALPNPFKIVYYYPIDAEPKPDWITDVVSKVEFPVAYTKYGYNESVKFDKNLEDRLEIIYHGNDFNSFYYVEDRDNVQKFRSTAFRGDTDGKFLIVNVNRNQRRKDIARSLMIMKELKDRGHRDSILYLHMAHVDVGGSIIDMATAMGLVLGEDYLIPENFSAHEGMPIDVLNMIYNSADVFLTTTHGEGWGLSVTEAMATKTPVVAPNNTSLTEMLSDNRGVLVDSGSDPSMWIIKDQDNDRLRPLMDVAQAADLLIELKEGTLTPDIDGAHRWVTSLDWDNIASQWETIIDKASQSGVISSGQVAMNRAERRRAKRRQ